MLSQAQKIKIRQFTEEKIKHNDSMHRMPHIEETVKWALRFANLEKADRDVCWASAMLHDICKWEEEHGKNHGITGAETAAEYLTKLGIDKEFVEKVKDAIYYHDKPFEGGSKERQILWDADKMNAVTLEAFRTRVVPYFMASLSKEEALMKAKEEYYFFYERFHTSAGKKEAEKHKPFVEKYIAMLESQ